MHGAQTGLNTDLYELTMAAGYHHNKLGYTATFELFSRDLPDSRPYLVSCGLHRALQFLQQVRFTDEQIDYLRNHDVFSHVDESFFSYLKHFRFTGTVRAVPEGTVVFGNEPMIQVTAPIIEAQLVETFLLSAIHIETLVATKASRIAAAAASDGTKRTVVDFGSRRAHGPEAGIAAARAAYCGGCSGTSNTQAGMLYGIPTFGTMAHSWVEAFEDEQRAFESFAAVFPDNTILIIDTYDTVRAVDTVINLGSRIQGVRLDSGDIEHLSKTVRAKLDEAGLSHVKIIASGNMDEYRICDLVGAGAPINGFGVGTSLVTSDDTPSINLVYKLVEVYDESGKRHLTVKTSSGKRIYPGRKEVYRIADGNGTWRRDRICLPEEPQPDNSAPLMVTYMENGKLLEPLPVVADSRNRFITSKPLFDANLFVLDTNYRYPAEPSEALKEAYEQTARKYVLS